MKKMSSKFRLRIKIHNLNLRKLSNTKNIIKHKWHISLPTCLTLAQPKYRDIALNHVKKMQTADQLNQVCYLDFHKVKALMPDGVIHLLHHLDRLSSLKIVGRVSQHAVVKAMLSKLGIHNRMRLPSFEYKHGLVDQWYFLSGEKADFGEEFKEISDALKKVFTEEHAFTIETAISEAVTNVVHHAYDKGNNNEYKKWLLLINIKEGECDIVISDLGQTIPKTAPKSLSEKFSDSIPIDWFKGKNDADRIAYATTWRKSSTNHSHRGYGFDNIMNVQDVRKDTKVLVFSRNGGWSSINGKKKLYSTPVNGTIVHLGIPLAHN